MGGFALVTSYKFVSSLDNIGASLKVGSVVSSTVWNGLTFGWWATEIYGVYLLLFIVDFSVSFRSDLAKSS